MTKKENSTLGLLQRNLRIKNMALNEHTYKALVRPKLEYASIVWDPPTVTLNKQVEKVQRRAAHYVTGRYHNTSSIGEILQDLHWPTLEQRRKDARATMLYKVVHGLVALPADEYLTPSTSSNTRHTHAYKFLPYSTRLNVFQKSFFPRTVPDWNGLASATIGADTLAQFKTELARERKAH